MNSLSIFLWLADTIGNVQTLLVMVAIISGLVGILFCIIYACQRADSISRYPAYEREESVTNAKWSLGIAKWMIPLCLFTGFTAAVVPSKNTMYAIAASELGEEMLQSTIAKKSLAAVEAWIDKQLAPTEKK